jgi:Xaa-Pro aminopeptidase
MTLAQIESVRATGRTLARALDVFAAGAAPDRSTREAVAAVEGFLASEGHEGRVTLVAHQPWPAHAAGGHRFGREAVVTVNVTARPRAADSSWPWYEISQLFAFSRLSPEADRCLGAVERSYQAAMLVMAPGAGPADVRQAVERAVEAYGYAPAGRQRMDCHPARIGTVEVGNDTLEGWRFAANEAVVFCPSPLPARDETFRITEMMLVRPDGAVPMSPRGSIFRRIRA